MKLVRWLLILLVGGGLVRSGSYWMFHSTAYRTPDYSRLEQLLAAKQWQAADAETTRLIHNIAFDATTPEKAFGHYWFKLSGGLILQDFPCQEVQRIDQLWRNASGDHFGFTPQATIWNQVNPDIKPYSYNFDAYEAFEKQIGWDGSAATTEKPVGYFPSSDWMQAIFQTGEPWMEMGRIMYEKLATCQSMNPS